MSDLYKIKIKTNSLEEKSLSEYKGKVLLIVNTASKCGFTPQYNALEDLYKKHKAEGFEVLSFPSNQFLNQEPGTNDDIQKFCSLNFNTTFPIFDKIDVKGDSIHPLFRHLTENKKGAFGSKKIKWNFTKFLVDRKGNIVKRFAPYIKPEKIEKDIISLIRDK